MSALRTEEEAASARPSPRNRLASAVRSLIEVTVVAELDDQRLEQAAATLEEVAATLQDAAPPGRRRGTYPDPARPVQDFFPTSPIAGFENPLAPPMRIWAEKGEDGRFEVAGEALFGQPYEGPPTCVHGGVIAELFDELLGTVNIANGNPGMTGTLTVRYRRPTPLAVPLTLRARPVGQEGRKVTTWGAIYLDGELTAEATGIFIEADPSRLLDLAEASARTSGSEELVAEVEALRRLRRGRPAGEGTAGS